MERSRVVLRDAPWEGWNAPTKKLTILSIFNPVSSATLFLSTARGRGVNAASAFQSLPLIFPWRELAQGNTFIRLINANRKADTRNLLLVTKINPITIAFEIIPFWFDSPLRYDTANVRGTCADVSPTIEELRWFCFYFCRRKVGSQRAQIGSVERKKYHEKTWRTCTLLTRKNIFLAKNGFTERRGLTCLCKTRRFCLRSS